MIPRGLVIGVFVGAAFLASSVQAGAQVTTATLYGVVRDASGGILPGVNVTVTHQGTSLTREAITDGRGEFALPGLPAGPYAIKIELSGFKTYNSSGLTLGAGQEVRQTYALEVGALAETVTVVESAPLIQTASTAQVQTMGGEVQEIPVSRRNLQNVILLGSGVSSGDNAVGGGRAFRVNGVGDGGSAITVDGSSAQTNPENRGFGNYGGQNQIEILSVEAVAEVQVVKGVLAAEYGGSIGGQVNMITRSGTNQFHGSLLENFQSDKFSSRDPFLPATTAKPKIRFNQFGGSLGGPILRNRVLFFTSFEGYREESGVTVQGGVATQATRDRMLAALPFPETKMILDNMPLPNVPVNEFIGRYTDAKTLVRRDNTFLGKVDFEAGAGRLSVTASRMRPFASVPRIQINNNQQYTNGSKRVSTNYVLTSSSWVSESRFGWNRNTLDRFDGFWLAESPTKGAQSDLYNVRKRIPTFSVTGLFGSGDTEILALTYDSYNLDQKVTRLMGPHSMKFGFRWAREIGFKSNPQTNRFTFASLDDLLANKASDFLLAMGNPPHRAWVDQFGGFIQDDWRVTDRFVLNFGLRYDYYPGFGYKSLDPNDPAEVNNLNNPTDIRKMDFGAPRPLDKPIDDDKVNFAPRAGFAWTADKAGRTVVRGGVGFFTTGNIMALFQNAVARPFTPIRQGWNRTEQEARGVGWPFTYAEDAEAIATRDAAGKKYLYYLLDRYEESTDRASHLRCAAADRKPGVGLRRLRPHQRRTPAHPRELCERLQSSDRHPAQPERHPRRVVHHRRADHDLQRVRGERPAQPVPWPGPGDALHPVEGLVAAGRQPGGQLQQLDRRHHLQQSPGLLRSRPRRRLLAAHRRGPPSRHRHGDLRHPVARRSPRCAGQRARRVAGVERAQFPNRRTAADHPGVGYCEQPARLQRRQPGVRQLARYAAVPRSQCLHTGPNLADYGGDGAAG